MAAGGTGSLNKTVGIVVGAVYLVIGILGFILAESPTFAGPDGGMMLGLFMVNPLHNIVHLLIGGVLLGTGLASAMAATVANGVVGVVYLLVGILGIVSVNTAANVLALNTMDHLLHFATAVVLLVPAIMGDGARRRRSAAV